MWRAFTQMKGSCAYLWGINRSDCAMLLCIPRSVLAAIIGNNHNYIHVEGVKKHRSFSSLIISIECL